MQLKKTKKTFSKLFTGLAIKNGKKGKAQKSLNKAFYRFFFKTKIPITIAVKTVVLHLGNIIELKKVRVGRNIKSVPYPIKKARQKFNVLRTFFNVVRKEKKLNEPMFKRVATHFISIAVKLDYKTKNIKKSLNLEIVKNRANAHFRW